MFLDYEAALCGHFMKPNMMLLMAGQKDSFEGYTKELLYINFYF